jgi:hypothetical protein
MSWYPKRGKAPKPKIKSGGSTVKVGKIKTANGGSKGGK